MFSSGFGLRQETNKVTKGYGLSSAPDIEVCFLALFIDVYQ
jgi:hypothetical protein